jgi:exodeoxyribonuclease VII large subunit
VWEVGALLRALADSLDARFNPVAVRGEISSFTRAASGHCYFTLKDEQGQIRCAMFRRAASLLDFAPREGQVVELRGRLGVYEPRGELQLVVESLKRAGEGSLFERFLQLKAKLESEGLFDVARKRALPLLPRAIGLVTSPGAAALHDVLSALARRAPHIPVVFYPASVQGAQAAAELQTALRGAYARAEVDVILLVRGGGAMEDLWSFNDEALARLIVQSPVPLVCGVGHETDFTIADFCADVRAPTPTAAAELAAQPQAVWLGALELLQDRLRQGLQRQLDSAQQSLDRAAGRLGQPSHAVTRERAALDLRGRRLAHAAGLLLQRRTLELERWTESLPRLRDQALATQQRRLEQARLRLELLDPRLVLQRGYAWLADAQGQALTRAQQARPGQAVVATLADGELDLEVRGLRP